MSSIWSSGAAQASASPFTTSGMAPVPGGLAASKFQSLLQSAGQSGESAAASLGQSEAGSNSQTSQLGMSPSATSNATGAQDTSSTSSATITANDFLSLLVTEMQNQDPTAQTDPNAYIDQLVQINSLEQLISINQNLTTALTPTSSATGQLASSAGDSLGGFGASGIPAMRTSPSGSGASTVAASTTAAISERAKLRTGENSLIHGNLSVPSVSSASRTVARSLGGHSHATTGSHAIRDIPVRSLP